MCLQPMANGPNSARQKKSSGMQSLRLRQFIAVLNCIASGARDESEILELDITYKNVLNENKLATVSMFDSIYLACKKFQSMKITNLSQLARFLIVYVQSGLKDSGLIACRPDSTYTIKY